MAKTKHKFKVGDRVWHKNWDESVEILSVNENQSYPYMVRRLGYFQDKFTSDRYIEHDLTWNSPLGKALRELDSDS